MPVVARMVQSNLKNHKTTFTHNKENKKKPQTQKRPIFRRQIIRTFVFCAIIIVKGDAVFKNKEQEKEEKKGC